MSAKLKVIGTLSALVAIGWISITCSDRGQAKDRDGERAAASAKVLNLAYEFSEGWLVNHDLYVTNACGEDLSGVRLRFTLVGENASPAVDRYWASWPLGARRQISVPVEQVTNVQEITVAGRADQGVINVQLAAAK